MTRLKSSGGLMAHIAKNASVIVWSGGTAKVMKQTTFNRHNRKTMKYRNGEEVKPFDLIAVAYSSGLDFGLVRTTDYASIQYYSTYLHDVSDNVSSSYALRVMKEHLDGKRTHQCNYIHGENDERRIVKVTADQLPMAHKLVYEAMKQLIKEKLNRDLP